MSEMHVILCRHVLTWLAACAVAFYRLKTCKVRSFDNPSLRICSVHWRLIDFPVIKLALETGRLKENSNQQNPLPHWPQLLARSTFLKLMMKGNSHCNYCISGNQIALCKIYRKIYVTNKYKTVIVIFEKKIKVENIFRTKILLLLCMHIHWWRN